MSCTFGRLISRLNDDVSFEIFLHFVATDWDDPFTLILVCTAWRDMVLSKPRLWTWVMVDVSNPEWNQRAAVAAHLSRNLPLQAVLRTPFISETSISHIVGRCTTLFLQSHYPDEEPLLVHPPAEEIVPFEAFLEDEEMILKGINDSIMSFLKGVSTEKFTKMTILSEDDDRACFAYSAWTIYEQMIEGISLRQILRDNPPFLVTTLIFQAAGPAPSPPVKILDIWELLPSLPHLSNLQLCADFIEMDSDDDLPRICLPSLLSLFIDSDTARKQLNYDFLDLFFLLEAPVIHSILLRGDWRRLTVPLATLLGELTPEDLRLSFSNFSFSGLSSAARFDGDQVIQRGLKQLTFEFPCPIDSDPGDSDHEGSESNTDNSAPEDSDYGYYEGETEDPDPEDSGSEDSELEGLLTMPKAFFKAMKSLMRSLPNGCSVQLCGGDEIERIVRSAIPASTHLAISYRPGIFAPEVHENQRSPRLLDSLTLEEGLRFTPIQGEWLCSAERVCLEEDQYLDYLVGDSFAQPTVMKSLDTGICIPRETFYTGAEMPPLASRNRFMNLTELRCLPQVAKWIIGQFEVPTLHVLTLAQNEEGTVGPFRGLSSRLVSRTDTLVQLATLGLEGIPDWNTVLEFLMKFNQSPAKGISTLKLPGLPHPSILTPLVQALRNEAIENLPDIWGRDNGSYYRSGGSSCISCFKSGWSCYGVRTCERFSGSSMVSISKDTTVGDYQGPMGEELATE